jgi:S-adenosylmethionine synthetase
MATLGLKIGSLDQATPERQMVEIVERKGIGHPDSICDEIMECAAVQLARTYQQRLGTIVHFNLDKGLLAAGAAERWFGGGRITAPMRIIFGDRATFDWNGTPIPVDRIVEGAARGWIRAHLPHVAPDHAVVFQSEIRPGSPELQATVPADQSRAPANDTSAAVGYAPLTATERLVLAAERFLNGPSFKSHFPDTGQDVKVMAFRVEDHLRLTVAMPFLAPYITSENQYFRRKAEAAHALTTYLDTLPERPASFDLELNHLDAPGLEAAGVYLSVTGTSAEDGDSGEVGRGNRVNGLISLNRPASAEVAAGKNPVSHVGKLYNVLAFILAHRIHQGVPGVREAYVWLASQIGQPVAEPALTAVQVALAPGVSLPTVRPPIERIVRDALANLGDLTEALLAGRVSVS